MKPIRKLLTVLNLHFAVVALLVILNLGLAVRFFLAWGTFRSSGADQLQQRDEQMLLQNRLLTVSKRLLSIILKCLLKKLK